MKISDSISGIELIEADGCKILNKYIDNVSQLLIVEELDLSNNNLYYYTIDQNTRKIINYSERNNYFSYLEEEFRCKNSNYKIISKREINLNTGKELIHEKLVDGSNGILLSRTILGFNKEKLDSLDEIYLINNKAKEKERLFWVDEYSNYSIENKVKYWISNIHHGMRMQGEATADPYSEFSVEWYKYVKSIESDFDFIFSEVVPRLGINFNWDEYYRRIEKVV